MDEGSNRRVVVVFPGALGDLVLAMPTLAALRARHAGAHLTLAVPAWLEALAATSGVADATASLDAADAVGLFGGERLPSWMRARPRLYAWIGDRDPELRARLDALSSRADLFRVVRDDGPEHAAVAYARQVGVAAAPAFAWPEVPATARVERTLARLVRPVLAVHAGAGSLAKRWAPEGFRDVATRWRAAGGDVAEVVGPADRDVEGIVAERLTDWTLPEVRAFLGRVAAYVGNDSGVTHLAAASGVPVVAVYGPTPAARWAPGGRRVAAIQDDRSAADRLGIASVASARVWAALHPYVDVYVDVARGGHGGVADPLRTP